MPWHRLVQLGVLLGSLSCQPQSAHIELPRAPTRAGASPAIPAASEAKHTKRKLPAVEPAEGYVLLRIDAVLRDAPADWATQAELMRYGASAHARRLEMPTAARIVGRAGPYYAIAGGRAVARERQCYHHDARNRSVYARHVVFDGFDVTVFVHERHLHPVLTEVLELAYPGGGRLRLEPGLALGPPSERATNDPIRETVASPLRLALPIPEALVGRVYQARPRRLMTVSGDAELHPPCDRADCQLRFGGDLSALVSDDHAVVDRGEEQDAHTWVTLRGACMHAQARVPTEALRPIPESRSGQGFGSTCGGFTMDDFSAPSKTPVFFPDGRRGGQVGPEPMSLHRHLSEMVGELRCFKRHPTERTSCGAPGKFLLLCFEPESLTRVGARL